MIHNDIDNFADEMHDRYLDDIADAFDAESFADLCITIHDSRYARMTPIAHTPPIDDDDALTLAFTIADDNDYACCIAARDIIHSIYAAADYKL